METIIFAVWLATSSFLVGYYLFGPGLFNMPNLRSWKDHLLNDFKFVLVVGFWLVAFMALVLLFALVSPGALENSWIIQNKDKAEAIGLGLVITGMGAGGLVSWARKYQGLRHRLIFWK